MQNKNAKCQIRCNTKGTQGITKVIISQNNYDKIVFISSVARKTIQEVTGELLSYALANCELTTDDGTVMDLKLQGV